MAGGRGGVVAVHPFVLSVDAALVERAHAMGLAVNVWTVNAPEDLRAMVAAGVDTVITDRLREALIIAALRGPTGGCRCKGASEKGLVTGPNGGERPWSTKMVGHERRRMRQADTRSGRPGGR